MINTWKDLFSASM